MVTQAAASDGTEPKLAPKVRRGRYAPSERRQAEIVAAAMELYAQRGFRTASTRDVAQAAGISEAGMRHHFPDKVSLLRAVLQRREDEDTEKYGHRESGMDVLQGTLQVVEHNAATPGLVELYTVLSAEATEATHPAHGHFRQRYEWMATILVPAFDRLRDEGRLTAPTSSESLARQLVALMDGLQVQWLYDRSFDMAAEVRHFFDLILAPED